MIGLICVFGVVLVRWILPPILWPGGIGIGKDNPSIGKDNPSTKTTEKDKQGNIVKTIETFKYDDGKTLWDWGSLLGVPLILVFMGYILQQKQQERADNEIKEEVLQTYFDRLSGLLIDSNLIALSYKANSSELTPEQVLLDSSLDVIRARTLSILRRFENDTERKTSVINFLIETEIVGKLKLNLSEANLSGANLKFANLSDANLSKANLSKANLSETKLSGANLSKANLSEANLLVSDLSNANLSRANLSRANLFRANFYKAQLKFADLTKADLTQAELTVTDLTQAELKFANLSKANLSHAYLSGADLSGADLSQAQLFFANLKDIKWNSETVWPDKSKLTNAENIPENLKKELGITP